MKKVIIILAVIVIAVVGTMYLIDSIKMKNGEEVVFGTWGKKYSAVVKTSQNENAIKEEKYSKTIANTTIELNIPSGWNYKEKFGVCGTERISKNITLNNGNKVVVGYHAGDEEWKDIIIETDKNIVAINPNLPKNEADEAIEIIKTVNIK